VAVPAIHEDTGDGCKEECRDLAAEADDAEQEIRPGEAVDQPAGGDPGDPGTDQRDGLPAEEEAIVAVAEGADEGQ